MAPSEPVWFGHVTLGNTIGLGRSPNSFASVHFCVLSRWQMNLLLNSVGFQKAHQKLRLLLRERKKSVCVCTGYVFSSQKAYMLYTLSRGRTPQPLEPKTVHFSSPQTLPTASFQLPDLNLWRLDRRARHLWALKFAPPQTLLVALVVVVVVF